jgi:hypothetical protein
VAAAPSVSIISPVSGGRYAVARHLRASFRCAEGANGPGIASCVGTVGTGKRIDTFTPGRYTFTVTATSRDGQVTTKTVSYVVRLPSNRVSRVRRKPHSDGTFIVTANVPGPGRVAVLVTAWQDNFATTARQLQPYGCGSASLPSTGASATSATTGCTYPKPRQAVTASRRQAAVDVRLTRRA